MNDLDKNDVPEVSGGYTPRPGDFPCTDPPTFPKFPGIPELPPPRDPSDPLEPVF